MTGELCAQGFARRSEDYDQELARCRSEAVETGLNRLMVDKALALGTAETLTPQERCLMAALLAHLDISKTAGDATAVWPSAERLCRLLAIAPSSLRRLKASLEDKGFLLRRYDQRNRPLKDGAIDLKPFLLRVPEICEALGHTERQIRDDRHSRLEERHDQRAEIIAHPLGGERPKRNLPRETFVRSDTDDLRMEDVCPLTKALLPEVFGSGVNVNGEMDELRARSAELIKDDRAPRLLSWAERRHGSRAGLALAVAATSPKIRDRAAWLGWFATTTSPVDLEGSAEAILKARPKPMPQGNHPPGSLADRFVTAFAAKAGEEPAASYLSQASFKLKDDQLVISVPTRLAQQRLDEAYQNAMMDAVEAVNAASYRVERLRQ
ncbi:MAG: helix-turn-helix domain-containing protein [Pseudomonadota bacterium]